MFLALLACTEERADSEAPADAKATADTAETSADCVPTPDIHAVPAMPVRFDASGVIAQAREEGEVATTLEVWLIALTFSEYDQKRCDDTLKTDYLMGVFIQDLTEYSWMDADLTGTEGWSVVAATLNSEHKVVSYWFAEAQSATEGDSTIEL